MRRPPNTRPRLVLASYSVNKIILSLDYNIMTPKSIVLSQDEHITAARTPIAETCNLQSNFVEYVLCSTCNHHHDMQFINTSLIETTDLSFGDIKRWHSCNDKLSGLNRLALKSAGWEFGNSISNIIRCPNCAIEQRALGWRLLVKESLERYFTNDERKLQQVFKRYSL